MSPNKQPHDTREPIGSYNALATSDDDYTYNKNNRTFDVWQDKFMSYELDSDASFGLVGRWCNLDGGRFFRGVVKKNQDVFTFCREPEMFFLELDYCKKRQLLDSIGREVVKPYMFRNRKLFTSEMYDILKKTVLDQVRIIQGGMKSWMTAQCVENMRGWFAVNHADLVPSWIESLEVVHDARKYRTIVTDHLVRENGSAEVMYGTWHYTDKVIEGKPINENVAWEMIDRLINHVLRAEREGVADILEKLYPVIDEDAVSRERLTYTACAQTIIYEVDGVVARSKKYVELFYNMKGLSWQAAASWILHTVVYTPGIRDSIMRWVYDNGVLVNGSKKAMSCLKEIHTKCRATQMIYHKDDVAQGESWVDWTYLHLLFGRADHIATRDQGTLDKREHDIPGKHSTATGPYDSNEQAFDRQVSHVISHIVHDAVVQLEKDPLYTFDLWAAAFLTEGSSGSAGKYSKEIRDEVGTISKRTWMAGLEQDRLIKILESAPEMRGVMIQKIEPGKERALLPSEIPHNIMEVILYGAIEEKVFSSRLQIVLERSATMENYFNQERRKRMMAGKHPLCSDYADFNYTHRYVHFKDMAMQLHHACKNNGFMQMQVWWQRDGKPQSRADFLSEVALWCAKAYDNAWMGWTPPGTTGITYVRQRQGLWSGWRTTQFGNTTMNYVYFEIARVAHIEVYGTYVDSYYHVCGDDSEKTCDTGIECLRLAALLTWQNHELNASKQLIDSEVSELLRVFYMRDGSVRNSLNRSISSFVSSDMQAPSTSSGLAYTGGTMAAIDNLINRGADREKSERMREALAVYYGTVPYPGPDGRGSVTASWNVLHSSVSSGGFGVRPYLGNTRESTISLSWPELSHPITSILPNGDRLARHAAARLIPAGMMAQNMDDVRQDIQRAAWGEDMVRVDKDYRDRELKERVGSHILNMNRVNPGMRESITGTGFRLAIGIPSGEGKTTLCTNVPGIFDDHDEIIDAQGARPETKARSKRVEAGGVGWEYLNVLHRKTGRASRKQVLLTWGPETTPSDRIYVESMLLKKGTGIRHNTDNRAALEEEPWLVKYYDDFRSRNDRIAEYTSKEYDACGKAYDIADQIVRAVLQAESPRYFYDIDSAAIILKALALGVAVPASGVLVGAHQYGDRWGAILELANRVGKLAPAYVIKRAATYHQPMRAMALLAHAEELVPPATFERVLLNKINVSRDTRGVVPAWGRVYSNCMQVWALRSVRYADITEEQRLAYVDRCMHIFAMKWYHTLKNVIKT